MLSKDGDICTSSNGISWQIHTLPSSTNRSWQSIAYGNGIFIAVGDNLANGTNIIFISSDGINWTQQAMPVSSRWMAVAYGNGTFVAIAEGTGIAAASSDGITWNQSTLPNNSQWFSITYGRGMFVAASWTINNSDIIATSADGITWNTDTLPAKSYWRHIAYGADTFVIVPSAGDRAAVNIPAELGRVRGWSQLGNYIYGKFNSDLTGIAMAFSGNGNRLVVSSKLHSTTEANTGRVTTYDWNGNTWEQVASDINGTQIEEYFGSSIDISDDGNRLAIGAFGSDYNGAESGSVRVYEWSGSDWVQIGNDIHGERAGDRSGLALSISADGNRLAIGAPENDGTSTVSNVVNWCSNC